MKTKISLTVFCLILFFQILSIKAQQSIADSYYQAAINAYDAKNYYEAIRLSIIALNESKKVDTGDPYYAKLNIARSLNTLSISYKALQNYGEAEKYQKQIIEILETIENRDTNKDLAELYSRNFMTLGDLLASQKKYDEGEQTYRKAIEYREKIFGVSSRQVGEALASFGEFYLKQNKLTEAEIFSKKASQIFASELSETIKSNPQGDPELLQALVVTTVDLAKIDIARKDYASAEEKLKQNLSFLNTVYGENSLMLGSLEEYALLLRLTKRPLEATKVERRIQRIKTSGK